MVGRVGDDGTSVEVTDAIPMLHSSLDVTPNVEIALEQSAVYASSVGGGGQTLVGYYHANELNADDRFGRNAAKIADAVCQGVSGGKGCALLVDTARLGQAVGEGPGGMITTGSNGGGGGGGGGGKPAVTLLVRRGGGWERATDQAGELVVAGGGCAKLVACYKSGTAQKIVDVVEFFQHLLEGAMIEHAPVLPLG